MTLPASLTKLYVAPTGFNCPLPTLFRHICYTKMLFVTITNVQKDGKEQSRLNLPACAPHGLRCDVLPHPSVGFGLLLFSRLCNINDIYKMLTLLRSCVLQQLVSQRPDRQPLPPRCADLSHRPVRPIFCSPLPCCYQSNPYCIFSKANDALEPSWKGHFRPTHHTRACLCSGGATPPPFVVRVNSNPPSPFLSCPSPPLFLQQRHQHQ